MKITTLGIDLAKNVFQLHGVDRNGKTVLTKRVSRTKLKEAVATLPPCLIGMEACGGAHFWARELTKLGHTVKLMSPQFVKPYVKSNKTDRNDAAAICEAVGRPSMRFVPVKTLAQQDIQMLHRVRSRLIKERTAMVNQIRGLMSEYGIVMPQSVATVRKELPFILEDVENGLTAPARASFADLLGELRMLDQRTARQDAKIKQIYAHHPLCQRLAKIPGIGPLTATALVAAVGNGKTFKNGRQMAAWLGLVPRQRASGGKQRLGGISKRGDKYLRMLLIHGARSSVYYADRKADAKSRWLHSLKTRRGTNIAAVALANKNARTAWALLAREVEYQQAA